jgi:hypothetical protein
MLHNAQSAIAIRRDQPLPFIAEPVDLMTLRTRANAVGAIEAWRAAGVSENDLRELATDLDGYLKGVMVDVRRNGRMGKMTDGIFNQRYARFFEPRIAIEETGCCSHCRRMAMLSEIVSRVF